ncbi:MAG TPA: YceI family protein [Bacteroidota bacterium]|nr:YceI family protein [Bacteroidota bacterium]
MKRFFFMLVLAFMPWAMHAQGMWNLDKNHSQVLFTVSHMMFSEVMGALRDFDVKFESAKEDFSDAQISATIKTSSIDTQNERRDGHLKAEDFLNAEKYPEIKFKSMRVEKAGNNTYKIHGELTIRDVTKPVVLETTYRGMIDDPWGNKRISFKATTTINRFDFGVSWNKALETGGLIAGKDVQITLLMQFVRPKQQG